MHRLKNWQLFAICVLTWGTTWFAITFQLGHVAPEVGVAMRFALAGAAARVSPDGTTVALTGVGATPFVLSGDDTSAAIDEAEIYGDRFASAEYRRDLAVVVAERALAVARERAKEDA